MLFEGETGQKRHLYGGAFFICDSAVTVGTAYSFESFLQGNEYTFILYLLQGNDIGI